MIVPPDSASLYKTATGYQAVIAHYDAASQEMGIPYEPKVVQTPIGPTHAVISGNESDKTLVFWHGLNANSTT